MTSEVLYHFTSPLGLAAILRSGYITLTDNNLNVRGENSGIVWLTSAPDPKNHGLKFDGAMPAELDKTSIRISVANSPAFQNWDEWSDKKGINTDYKTVLIETACARETYRTWYVSECEIPLGDVVKIENVSTGETIDIEEAVKALPPVSCMSELKIAAIDKYIMSQPVNIQVLLLEVRQAIRGALPDATEKMSWQMPTFWRGHNLIHFAAQKNHLGIYPGAAAMEYFAPKLIDYKTSKGAVQFPYKSFGAEQLRLIAEIAAWCGNADQVE